MTGHAPRWAHFVELRPDQLQQIADEAPVAYWPLGVIEHHGWSLPVGTDGLSAERRCLAMVKRTGGLMLPVMWWGGGGGHAGFKWTFYQPMDAAEVIFGTTIRKLIGFGFKCIVPVSGHGPWSYILENVLPAIAAAHPDVLIVGAPGAPGAPGPRAPGPRAPAPGAPAPGAPAPPQRVEFRGDHAARWETAFALALFPELVDMAALESRRDLSKVWPAGGPPPLDQRMEAVNFDVTSPCFSQWGEDSRKAKAEEAEVMIAAAEDHIVGLVTRHLGRA